MEKPKLPQPTLTQTVKLTLPITANFSPDGTKAVIGAAIENNQGVYGQVFVYDTYAWDKPASQFSYPYAVDVADISPDGQNICVTNMSNPVQIVRVTDGTVVATVPKSTILPNTIQYNKEGTKVLLADPNGVYLYDIAGNQVATVLSEYNQNRVAYFKPDDNNIIAIAQELPGSSQNGVQLWDISANKSIKQFKPKPEPVYQLAFSPKGDKLVCGQVSYLSVWDVESGQEVELLNGAGKLVNKSNPSKKKTSAMQILGFIPGKNIFFAPVNTDQTNGGILMCDIDNPESNIRFGDLGPDMSKVIFNLAVSPNGDTLLTTREMGDSVCVWKISGTTDSIQAQPVANPVIDNKKQTPSYCGLL